MKRKAYFMSMSAILLLILSMASPASATTQTFELSFIASNFVPSAPVDPVVGSFTLTFDPDQGGYVGGVTTGLTLNYLNIQYNTAVCFRYDIVGGPLYIGSGDLANNYIDSPGKDDFVLKISNITTNPVYESFLYAVPDLTTTNLADNILFRAQQLAAVPLPGSFLLLSSGFLGLAGWRRFRKG